MDSLKETKRHLPQLNIIRAIASLAVTIYHLGGKTVPILNYGWLGVEMFFILTGFVICWSLPQDFSVQDFPIFIFKRLIRIEPPFFISILIIIPISILIFHNSSDINLQNIILHLFYINSYFHTNYLSPVYWTLGIEFQFYILIGLIFPIISRSTIGLVITLIIINLFSFNYPVTFPFISTYMPLFTLGILIYLYKMDKLATLAFYFLFTITLWYIHYKMGVSTTVISCITGLIILFIRNSHPLIDFFSKISFSLYLTHDAIGKTLVILIGNLFTFKTSQTKLFAFSIGMAVAILFAYLFYILVEKRCIILSKKHNYCCK